MLHDMHVDAERHAVAARRKELQLLEGEFEQQAQARAATARLHDMHTQWSTHAHAHAGKITREGRVRARTGEADVHFIDRQWSTYVQPESNPHQAYINQAERRRQRACEDVWMAAQLQ